MKQKYECECDCGNDANVMHEDLDALNSIGLPLKYFLCKNCEMDFVNIALSKEQFKALLKHGHTTKEFMLHGDYYDEEGTALQPGILLNGKA